MDAHAPVDPEVLFFDEPSAGLDPISSRLLDELILDELRDGLGGYGSCGDPRAGQHLHHRQQQRVSRSRGQDHDRQQ